VNSIRIRYGYVLHMWTGLLEGKDGLPRIFSSPLKARAALNRYATWGHAAVCIRRCKVSSDKDGLPSYVIGDVVS
jgi:hypothetical protein